MFVCVKIWIYIYKRTQGVVDAGPGMGMVGCGMWVGLGWIMACTHITSHARPPSTKNKNKTTVPTHHHLSLPSPPQKQQQVVYAAGEALGVPVDWLRRAHVLRLLAGGDDVLAEDLMVQVCL